MVDDITADELVNEVYLEQFILRIIPHAKIPD